MPFSKFLKFWFPVITYSGIIFYVSSLPDLRLPLKAGHLDKLVHIFEFLPFGFLLARAITGGERRCLTIKICLSVVVLSFLYALSDEFHQIFVIGRSASLWDVLADTVGGVLGIALYGRREAKAKVSLTRKVESQ